MADDQRVTNYQYVVRLPPELREALHARAQQEDRPIARIIRSALRHYLATDRRSATASRWH
jgi:predicted DNA-binding protein